MNTNKRCAALLKGGTFFLKIIADLFGSFNYFLYLCGGNRGYQATTVSAEYVSSLDKNFLKKVADSFGSLETISYLCQC